MHNQPITYVAVLAGGRSSRMGRDKRYIRLGGESLLDRTLRVVAQVAGGGLERIYICGDVANYSCLKDEVSGLGPLSGVLSAMRQARAQGSHLAQLLVLPIDMPLLDSDLLSQLIEHHRLDEGHGATRYVDSEMPFVLTVSEHTQKIVEELCTQSDGRSRSVRNLLERVSSKNIGCPSHNQRLTTNLNHPQDLENMVAR